MSGRPARSSYQVTEGVRLTNQAVEALKTAVAALAAAGCQAALARARAALRSTDGARRHALNLELRARRRAPVWDDTKIAERVAQGRPLLAVSRGRCKKFADRPCFCDAADAASCPAGAAREQLRADLQEFRS